MSCASISISISFWLADDGFGTAGEVKNTESRCKEHFEKVRYEEHLRHKKPRPKRLNGKSEGMLVYEQQLKELVDSTKHTVLTYDMMLKRGWVKMRYQTQQLSEFCFFSENVKCFFFICNSDCIKKGGFP